MQRPELTGLSSKEAASLLVEWGPNAVPEEKPSPIARLRQSLWQPVSWMLEATIVLEFSLGERLEALIVGLLLLFNSVLSAVQETRSEDALALLKQRLSPGANVLRDKVWKSLSAAEIVPGDIVSLSLGGIIPADLEILHGDIQLDQSMLTGESATVSIGSGSHAYAGALVRRGEALGRVIATGPRTYFGRTADLVRIAHAESSEQTAVLAVVRNITVINGGILAAMTGYAHILGLPTDSVIKLALTAILASIPVALPATFTLAAAFSARVLARRGILLTHLEGVHEAASVDILCSDKTGTLTRNELSVTDIVPAPGRDRTDVLHLALMASSEDRGDPVDGAIREAALTANSQSRTYRRLSFVPFDPAFKQASADVETWNGRQLHVVKGAYATIAAHARPEPILNDLAEALQKKGERVLAVAAGEENTLELVGLIGLSDPPRPDANALISKLEQLGVRTIMVTGDAPATAGAIAAEVGLNGPLIVGAGVYDGLRPEDVAVVAGVLPEHKYRLVQSFQRQGHIVGMCGDGVNDAPALRQAQFGVAVSTATDVAKSAASLVLTVPGLTGIIEAVQEGRRVHRRVLSYALNALVKKIEMVPLLALGLVITGHAVLTPILMILLLVAGDFLTMALTTDSAQISRHPARWNVNRITVTALVLGIAKLGFTLSIILVGSRIFAFGFEKLQTLTYLTLALGSQAVVYVVRERGPLWSSEPSRWLFISSAIDGILAITIALSGSLSPPLSLLTIATIALTTIAFSLFLDRIKLLLARQLTID